MPESPVTPRHLHSRFIDRARTESRVIDRPQPPRAEIIEKPQALDHDAKIRAPQSLGKIRSVPQPGCLGARNALCVPNSAGDPHDPSFDRTCRAWWRR